MKVKKFYLCKKSAFHFNGEKSFEARQKYEFKKSMGNIIFLIRNEESIPMTKEYFKEHFKQKSIL